MKKDQIDFILNVVFWLHPPKKWEGEEKSKMGETELSIFFLILGNVSTEIMPLKRDLAC